MHPVHPLATPMSSTHWHKIIAAERKRVFRNITTTADKATIGCSSSSMLDIVDFRHSPPYARRPPLQFNKIVQDHCSIKELNGCIAINILYLVYCIL